MSRKVAAGDAFAVSATSLSRFRGLPRPDRSWVLVAGRDGMPIEVALSVTRPSLDCTRIVWPLLNAVRERVFRNFFREDLSDQNRAEPIDLRMLLTPEQAPIGGTVTIEAPVYYPCPLCRVSGGPSDGQRFPAPPIFPSNNPASMTSKISSGSFALIRSSFCLENDANFVTKDTIKGCVKILRSKILRSISENETRVCEISIGGCDEISQQGEDEQIRRATIGHSRDEQGVGWSAKSADRNRRPR
jgi:hypothetical protein